MWVRLGDMEEAVHQLRQGLVQGVLTRHAVDGLLSATITALSSSCEEDGSKSVEHRRNRGVHHRQRQAPKKPEMAWGWRVRRVVEDDEVMTAAAAAAAAGKTGRSGTVDETNGPVKNISYPGPQESPADRAWEYFTAAQRAATGAGMVRTIQTAFFVD